MVIIVIYKIIFVDGGVFKALSFTYPGQAVFHLD
jgi:hypothetical protein